MNSPEARIKIRGVLTRRKLYRALKRILKTKDPIIEIDSEGGFLEDSLWFTRCLLLIHKKITGINRGKIASSALAIYMACHERLSTPGATFFFHSSYIRQDEIPPGNYRWQDLQSAYEEMKKNEDEFIDLVSVRSEGKLSPDLLMQLMENNAILSAEEAIKIGIVHQLV